MNIVCRIIGHNYRDFMLGFDGSQMHSPGCTRCGHNSKIFRLAGKREGE